jgi:hypothetical protein
MNRLLAPLMLVSLACSPRTTTPPAEPVDTTNDAKCSTPRPGPSYECMQDCGPPVARPEDPPPGWSWLTAEDAASRRQFGCPICLPETTRIATPLGDRPVAELEVGDPIWTLDAAGRRVEGHVVHAGSTPIVGGHTLVQVTLADGRVVAASAGHPDLDGRALAELERGAALSGSTIVAIEPVPYTGARTYDVLPSGPTGAYWAEGVVLQSSFAAAALGPARAR